MANSLLTKLIFIFFITLSIFTSQTLSESQACSYESKNKCNDKAAAYPLKIISIFSIFFAGLIGVCTPLFTKSAPALKNDYHTSIIVVIKACASGVILATGFMHVLPDAFEMLTSNCLDDDPWHIISFAGFVTMLSALAALMVDSLATSLFGRKYAIAVQQDSEVNSDASGHCHGHNNQEGNSGMEEGSQLLRYRVVAVVLEVGVLFHSMVIGLTLGVSNNICTLKSLLPALCFHQIFVGIGLGGFILQAEYSLFKRTLMAILFSVMTPLGIALGLATTSSLKENSPTATITMGLLNACSADLLIYMALVDLLAADFMGPKLQGSIKLQIKSYIAVLLGAGSMALISRWA